MATFKDLSEASLSQARAEITSTNNVTWTTTGDNTSTITHGIIYYYDTPNSFDQGNITARFTDNDIWCIKEEPPKTYLELPAGKRLISI